MTLWLSRISFSCFVIAAVLICEVYKMLKNPVAPSHTRVVLYAVSAGVLLALGSAGVRARHRG